MSDFPQVQPLPLMVHTFSPVCSPCNDASVMSNVAPASLTWVANVAVYVPMYFPWPYPVARVFWGVGSTGGGNTNFGIFTPNGKRIYSTGSTGQSGTSTLQYVTPTAFVLPAGRYFFALANDGSTNRLWGATTSAVTQTKLGFLQQTSNLTLADPATFATPASGIYALCGVTRVGTSLPF